MTPTAPQFNWKNYISNYPDLQKAGINTESRALKHWNNYGIHENRTDTLGISLNNTSINLGGRFGNILFYNFVADYIARKNDIKFEYSRYDDLKRLGIDLYIGNTNYNKTIELTDENINTFFNDVKNTNIIIKGYFQTPMIAVYIRNRILHLKESIQKQNKFVSLNNNCYVHVRLGDIIDHNSQEDLSYYDTTLSKIKFDHGYISSDSIDHTYCKYLIDKYKLTIFEGDEVETMQFGSSCKHIVLSKGTFSWYIGVLSMGNSNVYYPDKQGARPWHGDIFVFPEWNKISYQ